MYFEVFIPSADAQGYDVKMTVEADNWMMALKSGLARTGESEELVRNVMCDIKEDNTIHVTDATSRRVFVLKELPEQTEESQHPTVRIDANEVSHAMAAQQPTRVTVPLDHQAAAAQALATPQPAPAPQPAPSIVVDQSLQTPAPPPATTAQQPARQPMPTPRHDSWTDDDGRVRIGSASYEALRKEEPQPKVVEEKRFPTGQRAAVDVGRGQERVSNNVMEEVFLEINQIHEGDMSMEQVINFVMDLSIEKVRAEAGSIMFADINGKELYFATARGPKAAEIMNFRVPMSKGIVGFCAREGVSLAISDAENDPRFYREISEALGYPTKSMLCAPIQFEGRVFGAIELLNKANNHFDSNEVNVLKYIGQQLGKYVYELIMAREKLE
jgi:hypothetical protein